ncbi:peptidase S8 [Phenylobacterium hankyongense]|uniref:Peptidase S8 n=1 Tax=Phenylobacterium hankyongense TaxID=1813876 RepID=A0A328B594_9CAUL|nr:S8 family serine peptidase [Phenylobacterium hankyongense]RAK61561.1 peptidase S8 [Phenylobacterium hankyongense]
MPPPKPIRTALAAGLALALGCSAPAPAQILGGGGGLGGGGLPSLPSSGLPSVGSPFPDTRAPASRIPDAPRPGRSTLPTPSSLPQVVAAPPAPALPQVGPQVGGVLSSALPAQGAPQVVTDALGAAAGVAGAALTEARRVQAQQLIRDHPDVVEADDHGAPVVRGEILALSPSPAALARARQAGFGVRASGALSALGLQSVTLTAPRGLSAPEAVQRLRALDPQGQYDFDHIYQESGAVGRGGETGGPAGGSIAVTGGGGAMRLGLVDGSVAAGQPALSGARLVQRAFAPGGARVTAHATAVASLMAGARGAFRGAAPGATLMVADVYGPTPTGGSANAIAQALAWLAQTRTPVVNISLVGPPNLLLGAAVKAMIDRGHIVVAAVGNDGPAAAPLYPAAYPGVVAVTAVDGRRRVLPEAGRGTHVDFAAPGAQMAAAGLDGGFVAVRGTSFAAPIVAGELARSLPQPDRAGAARAMQRLAHDADDLGARGADPVYGRGLVGFELRTDPAAVGARTLALRGP